MTKTPSAFYPCPICGTPVWRTHSDIHKYNRHQTCGKKCMGKMLSGKNNPFWGKTHTDESRALIKENRAKNPPVGTGPKKGIFKQSPEAKEKMSAALRERWATNRNLMLSYIPKGADSPLYKFPEDRRHRKNFTPAQRRDLIGDKCAYCGTAEKLEVDHIIPVFDGGTNVEENAQTLCRQCNLWKLHSIDIPRYKAAKAIKGA